MRKIDVTLLSIQLREAAETAKRGGMFEMASWLVATAEAVERKFTEEFVK